MTPFYSVPDQEGALAGFVRALQPSGGGDVPESGSEALAAAIQSPWTPQNGENGENGGRRHVIALFTDAPAHPLGKHSPGLTPVPGAPAPVADRKWRLWPRPRPAPAAAPPSDDGYGGEPYPRTMDELHDQWGREGRDGARIDQSAKRLLVFAPDETPWREIAETWDKTLFVASEAGTGLEDIALDEVIATIARSL